MVAVRLERAAGDMLALRITSIAPLPASAPDAPFEPDLARDGLNGFALPIARRVALLHSGDVTIEAGANSGTTACLSLPPGRVTWPKEPEHRAAEGQDRSSMPPPAPVPPFMGAVRALTPKGFSAAIFGAPHGTPYPGIDNSVHRGAPDAFRNALANDAAWVGNWDWDLGGPLLKHGQTVCDLGNLKTKSKDGPGNRALIEGMTRNILAAGAVPIMFGGDDSVPIPFLAAFYNQPPIVILQIDAHIDWRQEREGETMGFSSTMRRASEHDHVWRIVQAGARASAVPANRTCVMRCAGAPISCRPARSTTAAWTRC